MIRSYVSKWRHGDIDNVAVANKDGRLRLPLWWFDISCEDANDPNGVFLISLYSRETILNAPASRIATYEILKDWPERTSRQMQPPVAQKAVAEFDFVPERTNLWAGDRVWRLTPALTGMLGIMAGLVSNWKSGIW
jgi:hypothetical protein